MHQGSERLPRRIHGQCATPKARRQPECCEIAREAWFARGVVHRPECGRKLAGLLLQGATPDLRGQLLCVIFARNCPKYQCSNHHQVLLHSPDRRACPLGAYLNCPYRFGRFPSRNAPEQGNAADIANKDRKVKVCRRTDSDGAEARVDLCQHWPAVFEMIAEVGFANLPVLVGGLRRRQIYPALTSKATPWNLEKKFQRQSFRLHSFRTNSRHYNSGPR